jgi:hypothetical protein
MKKLGLVPYASQGSGIASGASQPKDFTWTAGS